MSKKAIALLQAARTHELSQISRYDLDKKASTVAEYADAIAAVQKLMADKPEEIADLEKAYELLFKENGKLAARLDLLSKGPQAAEIAKACWEFGQASGGSAYRNAFWDGVRFTEEWISKTAKEEQS